MVVTNRSSCAGLTARDSGNVFVWSCRQGNQVDVVTVGYQPGKGLVDLLDFTTTPASWRMMDAQVLENGVPIVASMPGQWWNTPVTELAGGGVVTTPGVFVVRADIATPINVTVPKVTLVFPAPINSTAATEAVTASTVDFLWLEGSGITHTGRGPAVRLYNGRFHTLSNITLNAAMAEALELWHMRASRVINLNTASTGTGGITMTGCNGNLLDGAVLDQLGSLGGDPLVLRDDGTINGSGDNLIRRVRTKGGNSGISITGMGGNNTLVDVTVEQAAETGLLVDLNDVAVRMKDVRVFESGLGMHIRARLAQLDGLTAGNNNGGGIEFAQLVSSRVANVLAVHNGGEGVRLYTSNNNVLMAVGAHNNGGTGIYLEGSSDNTIMAAAALNNVQHGVAITTTGFAAVIPADRNFFHNVASVANGGHGYFLVDSYNNTFSGWVVTGGTTNTMGPCSVSGGASQGLFGTATNNFLCSINGGSSATLDPSGQVAVVGQVDDAANGQGQLGPVLWDNVLDFGTFAAGGRTWGRASSNVFPNVDQRGNCGRTMNCSIWDHAARVTATSLLNRQPGVDGAEGRGHGWSVTAGDCALIPGASYNRTCGSTLALGAVEASPDPLALNNGNLLCEEGERCRLLPNIGAYQGDGADVPGVFTAGAVLSNVQVVQPAANGRW